MKNRGYITVFVSLLLTAVLLVAAAVIKICAVSDARIKSVTALNSACNSIRAEWYNRYIFDHYHILLIDMECGGTGEAHIAEEVQELLKYDLGEEYSVESVSVAGRIGTLENDCEGFKKQIKDNLLYEACDYVVDDIMKESKGIEAGVKEEDLKKIDGEVADAEKEEKPKEKKSFGQNVGEFFKTIGNGIKRAVTADDPRKNVNVVSKMGIPWIIIPEDAELSDHQLVREDLPSFLKTGVLNDMDINTGFDNYQKLRKELKNETKWTENLLTDSEAILYASRYFNCFTDQVNDDSCMKLELEYIISGGIQDAESYSRVVKKLINLRLGFNFASLLKDTKRMTELSVLAAELTILFPPAQPLVKYLLAGCWSYVESVADVYMLLRGHKVPYVKNSVTWLTDIDSLGKLSEVEPPADESGLDYKQYLLILMAVNMKDSYYRMLDVMQENAVNAEEGVSSFRVTGSAVAFGVDAVIRYKDESFSFHEETGY